MNLKPALEFFVNLNQFVNLAPSPTSPANLNVIKYKKERVGAKFEYFAQLLNIN
jgi:hypothetical protein